MDGVMKRLKHFSCLAVCASALLAGPALAGHCTIQVADGHSYPPGSPQWVGHTMQELHASLGAPSFSLGKPYHMIGGPEYQIDVYTVPEPVSAGCIDAYKLNECGVITDYFCR